MRSQQKAGLSRFAPTTNLSITTDGLDQSMVDSGQPEGQNNNNAPSKEHLDQSREDSGQPMPSPDSSEEEDGQEEDLEDLNQSKAMPREEGTSMSANVNNNMSSDTIRLLPSENKR